MQNLDYEQIPFRCRRCHEYGHLFREFPLNEPKHKPGKEGDRADSGFTKVTSRKRGSWKQEHQEIHKKIATSNPFRVLKNKEKTLEARSTMNKVPNSGDEKPITKIL